MAGNVVRIPTGRPPRARPGPHDRHVEGHRPASAADHNRNRRLSTFTSQKLVNARSQNPVHRRDPRHAASPPATSTRAAKGRHRRERPPASTRRRPRRPTTAGRIRGRLASTGRRLLQHQEVEAPVRIDSTISPRFARPAREHRLHQEEQADHERDLRPGPPMTSGRWPNTTDRCHGPDARAAVRRPSRIRAVLHRDREGRTHHPPDDLCRPHRSSTHLGSVAWRSPRPQPSHPRRTTHRPRGWIPTRQRGDRGREADEYLDGSPSMPRTADPRARTHTVRNTASGAMYPDRSTTTRTRRRTARRSCRSRTRGSRTALDEEVHDPREHHRDHETGRVGHRRGLPELRTPHQQPGEDRQQHQDPERDRGQHVDRPREQRVDRLEEPGRQLSGADLVVQLPDEPHRRELANEERDREVPREVDLAEAGDRTSDAPRPTPRA